MPSAQPVEPTDEPSTKPNGASPQSSESIDPSPEVSPDKSQKPLSRRLDQAALDEAKRAYAAGERDYNAGDYKSAIENFRVAQGILPTPQAGYWLALSLQADGQVPEAIAELKTLLSSTWSERLGPEKLARAKAALEELSKQPGTVSLQTEPPGATISVDGEVRNGVSPLDIELQPGAHTLVISMPGYESVELELEVPPGSKGEQKLSLKALPLPSPPAAGAANLPPTPSSRRVVVQARGAVSEKPSNAGQYVVFGLAGAGAVVGTAFGIRALNRRGDFDKAPSDELSDKIDRDETIAVIGLGAAITFGLAGLVMATAPNELSTSREKLAGTASPPTRRGFLVLPYVSTRSGGGAHAVWRF